MHSHDYYTDILYFVCIRKTHRGD